MNWKWPEPESPVTAVKVLIRVSVSSVHSSVTLKQLLICSDTFSSSLFHLALCWWCSLPLLITFSNYLKTHTVILSIGLWVNLWIIINWHLLFLVLSTSLQYILELRLPLHLVLCLLWEADFSDIYSRLFDFLQDSAWCVLYFTDAQVGSLWTVVSCQVCMTVCLCLSACIWFALH